MLEDEENEESADIIKGYDEEESYISNIGKNNLSSELNKISEGLKKRKILILLLKIK